MAAKIAIVYSSRHGHVRAIAERFLESGASVSLWDMDAELTAATAGQLSSKGRVQAVAVDVSKLAAVEAATAETTQALGGIDILVANAGITGPNFKTWEYPPEEFARVVEVDLLGVFYCCRAIVPLMRAQKYGRIVTISSVAGKEGNPNAPARPATSPPDTRCRRSMSFPSCRRTPVQMVSRA